MLSNSLNDSAVVSKVLAERVKIHGDFLVGDLETLWILWGENGGKTSC